MTKIYRLYQIAKSAKTSSESLNTNSWTIKKSQNSSKEFKNFLVQVFFNDRGIN